MDRNIRGWYSYLLAHRSVKADLQGISSKIRPTRGSPQGGVLSPLVWNLIIDELLTELHGLPVRAVGYADDLLLLITGIDAGSMRDLMQDALDRVTRWGQTNGLSFNPLKTQCVLFTQKRKQCLPP